MFGLGLGIFPKDKLPKTSIPVHPHCMCRYVEVYDGEVDMGRMRNRTQKAGEEWLRKLSPAQQRAVLGVEGQKQFLADGSWQEYMRGWVGIGKPKYAKLKQFEIIMQLHAMTPEERRRIEDIISKIPPEFDGDGQPTSKYLQAIAKARGKPYNKGKTGYDRFFDDDGNPVWPPNNGAKGPEKKIVLKKGDKIYRRGKLHGAYASEMGASFEQCSIPKNTRYNEEWIITINKDVEFFVAEVAPWFDSPGGALQYRIDGTFFDLLESKSIEAVKNV